MEYPASNPGHANKRPSVWLLMNQKADGGRQGHYSAGFLLASGVEAARRTAPVEPRQADWAGTAPKQQEAALSCAVATLAHRR